MDRVGGDGVWVLPFGPWLLSYFHLNAPFLSYPNLLSSPKPRGYFVEFRTCNVFSRWHKTSRFQKQSFPPDRGHCYGCTEHWSSSFFCWSNLSRLNLIRIWVDHFVKLTDNHWQSFTHGSFAKWLRWHSWPSQRNLGCSRKYHRRSRRMRSSSI